MTKKYDANDWENRSSGISKADKHEMERRAMASISTTLTNVSSHIAHDITSLYNEYEGGITATAKLVKDFDKLDMIIQAYEYELAQPSLTLQSFFDSTRGKMKHPTVCAIVDELNKRRNNAMLRRNTNTNNQQ
jgi:putative hydrolase of HD superfamily